MKKPRETVNKNEDELVYVNEEYLIYKKFGQVTGTIDAPYYLLHLALEFLEDEDTPLMFNKKDYTEMMEKCIERIVNLITNYPDDEKISNAKNNK